MGANLDVLKAFLAKWPESREAACDHFLSNDFECIEPPALPQGGVFRGKDALIRIGDIYGAIWDTEVLGVEFWEDKDSGVVASRYLMRWTSKQTGKSLMQPLAEFNHIRDGKIVRIEVCHFDPQGLMATLQA